LVLGHSEDFNWQYGLIDYEDKIVLDIGADYGSTADYFLSKGASLVVAVEGSTRYSRNLVRNAKSLKNVIPICLWVTKPETLIEIIQKYRPDVAKVDCEGCEVQLFNVPDDVFSAIPEYVIETHSDALFDAMKVKCKRNNYEIWYIIPWKPQIKIVYAAKYFSRQNHK